MKRSPIKKKAKTHSRGWLLKRLEEIAKRFAKERDEYTCQRSGESVEGHRAHGSHVYPKSRYSNLRFDLNNIKCLSYYQHQQWHLNPVESGEWFKDTFPDRWEYLEERKRSEMKFSNVELKEFYAIALKCRSWQEYQEQYHAMFG